MMVDSFGSQTLAQVKRKNFFACAALLALGVVGHCGVSGSLDPTPLLALLGWSSTFVLLGAAIGAGWIPAEWSGVCSGLVSLVAATLLIYVTGGPASPYFPMLSALPLVVATFASEVRGSTVLTSLGMMGVVLLLDMLADMPLRQMLLHMSSFGLISGVAIYLAGAYRRTRSAEKAAQQERWVAQQERWVAQQERWVAQQERLAALERLAESERRRVRAERERAEVERLVLVGQLAAGVAHEVNNPLAFVKSNLHYLEQELLSEEGAVDRAELRDVLEETKQGVLRIQQIVADLRRFSREGETGEEGLPEDALHEAKRLASVRLRSLGEVSTDVTPGLPSVRLGQRQLVQVLVNLLLNAADAVEMAVPARRAHILVRAKRVESGVRLEVEDNGPGLSPEVQSRLFEPFFTTKPPGKGTGLGLALCREYVSRVGGTLHAENRCEGGARFVLVLPTVAERTSAPSCSLAS
ncbi:sensor histidine kinase [Archangium violaceum]|uniref:sensor histidine kinase n=1 Tax=Archangium violaceum TaxID=83451 RepID=UPI0037C139F9